MGNPLLDVRATFHGPVTVLRLVGWLTDGNAGDLERHFVAGVEHGAMRFVLDLSSAHFADSGGPAVFATWKPRLDEAGGCLILAAPSRSTLQTLVFGGLDKCLPVTKTVAEGLELARRKTESGRWQRVTV